MKKPLLVAAGIYCLAIALPARGQQADSLFDKIAGFPGKLFEKIGRKERDIDAALTGQTEKYLRRLEKQENEIRRRLYEKDSAAAKRLFEGSVEKYAYYRNLLNDSGALNSRTPQRGAYMPYTDSLSVSMNYIGSHPELFGKTPAELQQLAAASQQLKLLQGRFGVTDQVRDFIRQRREQLQSGLAGYTGVPGLTQCLNNYQHEIYYYSEQVNQYREALNDPDKMELLALRILDKFPSWRAFMHSNSILASMFPQPANLGSPLALAGLQTRSMVQQVLQTQLSSSPNAQAALTQNFQEAQTQLGQLRDRILKYGQGGADISDPSFTPNRQRTKPFLKRLEYGTNIQTTNASFYFPVTTDLGFSVGYRISEAAAIGLGGSYKAGWGSGFNHIKFSSQGASLRSYLDWKIKGSIYCSAGFEYNYQPVEWSTGRSSINSRWQQSGLVGLSKIVQVKSKFFKKTKLQLLWDFLSYRQIPRPEAFKFRIGYTF